MDSLDLKRLLIDNPDWEYINFDEFGIFVGPKYAVNLIEEFMEDQG